MPRELNTLHLHFWDISVRFLDQIFPFVYCVTRKAFFGHFVHSQGQAHVGLFQLYPTSMPCHSSRQVKTVPEISCCFKQWDSAIISTISASIASSNVIKAWFVHSQGWLSGNSSAKTTELTTKWCLISRTVRTNAFFNHGGLLLWMVINWLRSSQRKPAAHYMVNWQLFTLIWIYSHPTACCFLFLLLPVLRTIFKYTCWVIRLVAAVAASWWTNWCLRGCCGPSTPVCDVAPANRLELHPL